MKTKMVRRKRSTGNVKRLAVRQCILCALQVLLKDVPKTATPPDGITFPVGNTSVMNALTTTTEGPTQRKYSLKIPTEAVVSSKAFGSSSHRWDNR